MIKLSESIKAIIMLLVPLLVATLSWVSTGTVDAFEYANLFLGVVGAIIVYAVGNKPGVAAAAKATAAAATTLVVAVVQAIATGNWGVGEWNVLLTGFITTVLIYIATNVVVADSGGEVREVVRPRRT